MPQPQKYGSRLAGKVAVVTGAGAEGSQVGIGRAIALVLAGEGARVCCSDIDLARAEETALRINREGGDAFAFGGDVSDGKACARLVSETVARFGRLDVLVNNVGISTPTTLESIDDAAWSRIFDINLKSAMLMSKYSIPEMTKTGGGSIMNISSIAGIGALGSLAYGTSKAAMAQLAREIAVMHGRDGIRANTVAPGHLMTPHAMHVLPADMRETRRKIGPLGLEGDAWDVALAVCFLASDEARFITGVELPVDGGVTAIGPMAAHALIMRAD
ncbi:SDR family NAD(P)-dependent oxidoreductase [Ramlibacter sp. WS9]|uniref:SDR family NAD(P)-dependent oxidoreductase n=1 Tax=Ramlibacter sp. WS9 TaxID=1882741 RepID=UPI001141CA59|nr:SDR family NAD(P)-dependent oxidoreductase [Ramlibacter sp. WS9]ROZ69210.1 SDR family oxidoreductase [Ramlibacter sp. WS9]